MVDSSWRDRALCVGLRSETFFPDRRTSARKAKEVCYRCPVRRDCLAEAMVKDEIYGVWGGLSERERRRLRRRRLVFLEAS